MNDDDIPMVRSHILGPARVSIPEDVTMAATTYARLRAQVKEFQGSLASTEEVGACLTNFGRDVTVRVTSIGYHNPSLIIIDGVTTEGQEVRLVQHQTQLNLLLCKVLSAVGDRPHRLFSDEDDDESEQ